MREFTLLIGQISFIALLQTVLSLLMKELPEHVWIIKTACLMGSLYLLLQFVFGYLLAEISVFMPFPL